jgi:hypothetical protein
MVRCTASNPPLRGFYLRRHPGSKRTPLGAAHVEKLGWLLATKTAVQQPLTLASPNFSEIPFANRKRGMNLVNFAAQFRNLGLENPSLHAVDIIIECATLVGAGTFGSSRISTYAKAKHRWRPKFDEKEVRPQASPGVWNTQKLSLISNPVNAITEKAPSRVV